jgi:hypothetical protein
MTRIGGTPREAEAARLRRASFEDLRRRLEWHYGDVKEAWLAGHADREAWRSLGKPEGIAA